MSKAFPLVTRALQLLVDREVTPQLGLLKSTLLQLDSTFSERDYGASSFRDFAEKLAEAGLVALRSSGRSVLVELKEAGGTPEHAEAPQPEVDAASAPAAPAPAATAEADATAEPRGEAPQTSIVDGIRLLQRVLATPGAIARWPMYVRNVKQAMRAADPGFDERRHGNLVEILRSVQRDGLVRLDRDRQGVLRVFQGPQLRLPAAPAHEPADEAAEVDGARRLRDRSGQCAGGCRRLRCARCRPRRPPETVEVVADAAAADADAPITGEPEADVPAADGAPRRRRKAGTAAPRTKSTSGPQAAGARGDAAQKEDHGVRMILSHLRPVAFMMCATLAVALLWPPPPRPVPGSRRPRRRPQTPAAPVVSPYIAPPDVAAPPADAVKTTSGLSTKVITPGTGSSIRRPRTSSPCSTPAGRPTARCSTARTPARRTRRSSSSASCPA